MKDVANLFSNPDFIVIGNPVSKISIFSIFS
jgi:hypothetical protein